MHNPKSPIFREGVYHFPGPISKATTFIFDNTRYLPFMPFINYSHREIFVLCSERNLFTYFKNTVYKYSYYQLGEYEDGTPAFINKAIIKFHKRFYLNPPNKLTFGPEYDPVL